MGPARLSLYLIASIAGVAAIMTWLNRAKALSANSGNQIPVQKAADALREAWADNHTTV
ncbi:hypothetical protein [Occallatibacter riparius]|uniref:Uncharacterized protein n=1 Tax=Occallatibacter riparius TaxID=1002689 RepID=A0A9J7BV20_9BACT|nr:hypothetical protein [Occallatibacter riparius]UWZ86724.1 hypothetical protein MOP44_12430 [Occallatibacter riparius]